jgi:hypothetical protein
VKISLPGPLLSINNGRCDGQQAKAITPSLRCGAKVTQIIKINKNMKNNKNFTQIQDCLLVQHNSPLLLQLTALGLLQVFRMVNLAL